MDQSKDREGVGDIDEEVGMNWYGEEFVEYPNVEDCSEVMA